jgi:glycosyltransferase involved in cell wall biosynthesis
MNEKIIYITGTMDNQIKHSSGGLQYVISKIGSGLSKLGNDITVISSFEGDSINPFNINKNIKIEYLQKKYKHNTELSKKKKFMYWFYISVLLLKRVLKEDSKTIFISTSPPFSIILLNIYFIKNIKIVLWENVSFNIHGFFWSNIRKILAKNAIKIVVCTDHDANILKKLNNVCKIYNPSDFADFNLIKNKNSNPLKLLAAGRLVKQKGMDLLIDVANELNVRYNLDFFLIILGEGPENDQLLKKINTYKLNKKVVIRPFTNNIISYYKCADIFLLTSRYEGMPVVLLDALGMSLPCVAFDCETGPREVVFDKLNGFLVPCFDIQQFAEKIFYIYSNSKIYNELSNNSRIISKKFKYELLLTQWKDLINTFKNVGN